MNLNDTPSGERVHIAFFGCRNSGKSSLVNAITGQEMSIVSNVKGTTTDPLHKAMELLPLGPVEIIDTPGFDDVGYLGELRMKKTRRILTKTDIAVLVVDITHGKLTELENEFIELFKDSDIPYVIAYNKSDLIDVEINSKIEISVSALKKYNINELKELIASQMKVDSKRFIIGDIIKAGDVIVLVIPIDTSSPKGRIILPQVQTLRDILDVDAIAVCIKEFQILETLKKLNTQPRMVITDSQAFEIVNKIIPESIPLTSFSILMARYKGFLEIAVKGAATIKTLNEDDTVLISEGCTHYRQCNDIGSIKLPTLLKKITGKKLNIEFSSGRDFPDDLSSYKLVIHCGGCMLNRREIAYRRKSAEIQDVPFTNYGISIAMLNGILKRSLDIFPNFAKSLNEVIK